MPAAQDDEMSSDTSVSSPRASPEPRKKSGKKRKADQPEIEVDLALPEPPSKRAKRALKKGKPLPPKRDSDDDDDDDERAKPTTRDPDDKKPAQKKERSPYGVWIGNLRFTVTRDELRRWLVDNSGGSITDELITRVHLPSSRPKGAAAAAAAGSRDGFENKGFAYVDFATYEATVAAIALSETEWYRRRLLIKDATSFEGRPEEHRLKKSAAAATADAANGEEDGKDRPGEALSKSRKVFVGNLGFQTTEDDVRELFLRCGEIEWVKVATFEDSGKCKGYGWVKFADAAAADWAVKGFVKIREAEETEEDFVDGDEDDKEDEDEDDNESGSTEDAGGDKAKKAAKKSKAVPEKKVKIRKWWVNTLHGRRLKIEHAEDDQTRYKKRYGKGAHQKQNNGGGKPQQDSRSHARYNNQKGRSRDDSHQDGGKAARKGPAEASNFETDISIARLTGAAVKPEGKKITFD